ncbi:minor capsid protein [Lederbergia lenta]|uniref:minor capsid protein n=1 Tax=Lederbergia lenta TaxID=1467 RepID=UPI00203EFDB3|nr:minor capsid protein [Lederbergia lenta]MCM3110682.1 minor capsid protein [Lederbergia lenta]
MVNVKIDLSKARQKLSQGNVDRGRYSLANQALADMNPFVPKDDNILRQTGHVSGNGEEVIWNTPYAARLFYMYMYNYTTPGTGPRWDLKAKSMFISDWIDAFKKGADW